MAATLALWSGTQRRQLALYAPCPAPALQETKRLMRGDFAREWAAFAETEADYAWSLLSSPGVVAQLGAVLERLSGGKPKSKL